MTAPSTWQTRIPELVARNWEIEAIRDRLARLRRTGFSGLEPDWSTLTAERDRTLDVVQLRAEEYEFLTHSCAKGALLALMEQFGLGSWELTRAMSPFPGFGMTGGICGGVTGALVALGLFFGGDDPEDYEATGRTMTAAREFIDRFKKEFGTIMCPDLQAEVVFGRYMDPRASQENFEAFKKTSGYEKCALPPGVAARLAAGIILDSRLA